MFVTGYSALPSGKSWLDQSRGLSGDRAEADGRTVSSGVSELPHRAQYAAWLRYMTAAA